MWTIWTVDVGLSVLCFFCDREKEKRIWLVPAEIFFFFLSFFLNCGGGLRKVDNIDGENVSSSPSTIGEGREWRKEMGLTDSGFGS